MPINIQFSPGLGSGFGQAAYAAGQTQGAERGQQLYGQQLQLYADLQQRQQDNKFRYQQLFQQGALAQQELGARLYSQRLDLQQQEARDMFQARQRMLELGAQQAQQRERDQYEAAVGNFRQEKALAGQFQQHALDAQTNLGRDLFHAQFTADRDVYHARQSDQELQQRLAHADAMQQAGFGQQIQLHQMDNQARQERTDTRVGAQGTLAIRQFQNKLDELQARVDDGTLTEEQVGPLRQVLAQRLAGMTAQQARQQQQDRQRELASAFTTIPDPRNNGQPILGPDGQPVLWQRDRNGLWQPLNTGGGAAGAHADRQDRMLQQTLDHVDSQMQRERHDYEAARQRAVQAGQPPPAPPFWINDPEAYEAERGRRMQTTMQLRQQVQQPPQPGRAFPDHGVATVAGGAMAGLTAPRMNDAQQVAATARQMQQLGYDAFAEQLMALSRELDLHRGWQGLQQRAPHSFGMGVQILRQAQQIQNGSPQSAPQQGAPRQAAPPGGGFNIGPLHVGGTLAGESYQTANARVPSYR